MAQNHYYVSNAGSDSNDGSQARPWRTIQHADAALALGSGGTVVHVAPGTYGGPITTNRSGTATARIVFISDTKWGAKITTANWLPSGAYIDINGFDMTSPGANGYCTATPNSASNHDQHFIGNYCHDVGQVANSCAPVGGMSDGALNHDNWFIGNIIRHIGNSSTGTICNFMHGIYSSSYHTLIENNVISGASGWGIKHGPGGTLASPIGQSVISGNTLFNNSGGIALTQCADNGCGTYDYSTISNNIIINNGVTGSTNQRFGIDFFHVSGTHLLVSNNLIYGNLPSDYAHHGSTCTGGTPISGSDADGTAGGCPSTSPKSDLGTSASFVSFQSDTNTAPASNYNVNDYQLKSGSSAIAAGTTTCVSGGIAPCVPSTDFIGTVRPTANLTIGAFEYGSGADGPAAPTGLTAAVQ
jgi:hypothetical protein